MASVCVKKLNCYHHIKSTTIDNKSESFVNFVNDWSESIRSELVNEKNICVSHYFYVKQLQKSNPYEDDCKFYSECELCDSQFYEISRDDINRQIQRDDLLIRDIERKLNPQNKLFYLCNDMGEQNIDLKKISGHENDAKLEDHTIISDLSQAIPASDGNEENINEAVNHAEPSNKLADIEPFLDGNDTVPKSNVKGNRKGIVFDPENFNQLLHKCNNVTRSNSEASDVSFVANNLKKSHTFATSEQVKEQCIGQVVVKMNELDKTNKRLSLNLLFDKDFLDLCKHISRVTTNDHLSIVDNLQLMNNTNIEVNIPLEGSTDIDIDISLDHTEPSLESLNSYYESATDLEEKCNKENEKYEIGDLEANEAFGSKYVKMRTNNSAKDMRPKSCIESNNSSSELVKKINRISLFEPPRGNCSTPFYFPNASWEENENVDISVKYGETLLESSIEQTVGLPGFEDQNGAPDDEISMHDSECIINPNITEHLEDDFDSKYRTYKIKTSLSLPCINVRMPNSENGSSFSDIASYESLSTDDDTYTSFSDHATVDSNMADISSNTFETLLYIPRQSYDQLEGSVSDETCSHFSSMENITNYILTKTSSKPAEEDGQCEEKKLKDADAEEEGVSSDVDKWMKDIFQSAWDESDEYWKEVPTSAKASTDINTNAHAYYY